MVIGMIDYERLIDNAYIALNNCKDKEFKSYWEGVIAILLRKAGRLN